MSKLTVPHSTGTNRAPGFVSLSMDLIRTLTKAWAAVDRLADLFGATYVGWWEWAAKRCEPSSGRARGITLDGRTHRDLRG